MNRVQVWEAAIALSIVVVVLIVALCTSCTVDDDVVDDVACPGAFYCPCPSTNNPPCDDGLSCRRDRLCSRSCVVDEECDVGVCFGGVCSMPCDALGEPCGAEGIPEATCVLVAVDGPAAMLCEG